MCCDDYESVSVVVSLIKLSDCEVEHSEFGENRMDDENEMYPVFVFYATK